MTYRMRPETTKVQTIMHYSVAVTTVFKHTIIVHKSVFLRGFGIAELTYSIYI